MELILARHKVHPSELVLNNDTEAQSTSRAPVAVVKISRYADKKDRSKWYMAFAVLL